MGLLDPVSAGVQVFDAWMTRRQIDKWTKKLLFNYALSWFIASTAMWGATGLAAIRAGMTPITSVTVGFLSGLIAGASTLVTAWYRDPDLKGTQLTLRQDINGLSTVDDPNTVTVTRPK